MDIIKKINRTKKIWEIIPELSIKDLEETIKIAADHYYNTGEPLITDEQFDILSDRLKELKPGSDVFKQTGAPIKGKKVKLKYWMGSQNKLKTPEEVEKFTEENPGPYLITDKLDGISGLVTSNSELNLFTRGDGEYGQNITHLFSMINTGDPVRNSEPHDLRGEIIMSKENFEKYADHIPNARNMVAGIVNSKPTSIDVDIASEVDFVAYELIEPKMKPSQQMKRIKTYGYNVVYSKVYEHIDATILDDILQQRKKKSIYEIDGIIVQVDKAHSRNTSGNPSYSFAWKGKSESAITTVIEVIWKPSKDGRLVPRIHYESVKLSGATLGYTTGFNARFISVHKIGPGAKIKVHRSGDTIPYIVEVISPAKKPSFPDADYEWDKTKVNIILKDADENKTVIIQRLTKFLRDIGVENMSEGIVTKLVTAGYDTIPKIMRLEVEDLLELEGFQVTLAEKLYNNLSIGLSQLTVLKLMVASNCFGHGFGERKIRKILDVYPDIVTEYSPSDKKSWLKKIIDIEGFNVTTAEQFLSLLPDFQVFYSKAKKISPIKAHVPKIEVEEGGLFENEVVVFTGFRNAQWQKFIEAEGGRVATTVSGKTTMLIYADGEESSAKYTKAKKMGIKLIPKSAFAHEHNL